MLDLAAPVLLGDSIVGYRDSDAADTTHRLPDRLRIATNADGEPSFSLTLLSSDPIDGGLLAATWELGYPEVGAAPVVDARPVAARVRLRAVHQLTEEPTASAWVPVACADDTFEMPSLLAEPGLASLLVRALEAGSLGDSLVKLDVLVDVPARRLRAQGRMALDLPSLHSWGQMAHLDADGLSRAELQGALRTFVEDQLGKALTVEVEGELDADVLRDELVLRLGELGGVPPVTGAVDVDVASTSGRWQAPSATGRVFVDLSHGDIACLRSSLEAPIGEELAAMAEPVRRGLIRRVVVSPFETAYSLAVTNLVPVQPGVVRSLSTRVRRRVGNRLEDHRHDFAAGGAPQTIDVPGRRFFGQSQEVLWEAELVPGPSLVDAGLSEARVASGTVAVDRHALLVLDTATFGLDGITVEVDPAVRDQVAALTAELRHDPDGAPFSVRPLEVGDGWLAVDAAETASPLHLRLLALGIGSTQPVRVLEASISPLRRVHLGEDDLQLLPDVVVVELAESPPPVGEVEVLTVVLDAGDPLQSTRFSMRPGDLPRQWRRPRQSVFAPTVWWWSAEWLVVTPAGRQTIRQPRRPAEADRLTVALP